MQRLKNMIFKDMVVIVSICIEYSRVSPDKVGVCVRVLGLLESECRIATWNIVNKKKHTPLKNNGFHER